MNSLIKKPSTKNGRPQTFKICPVCSKEFGPLDRLSRKTCSKECKIKAQSTGRKTFRRTKPEARRAQRRLAYMIEKGIITRPTICEECGCDDKKIEGAHKDYSNPVDVRWLCRSCHVRWDKLEPKNATYIVGRDYTGKKATLESNGKTYEELKNVQTS